MSKIETDSKYQLKLTANAKHLPKNKNSLYIEIYSDSNLYILMLIYLAYGRMLSACIDIVLYI